MSRIILSGLTVVLLSISALWLTGCGPSAKVESSTQAEPAVPAGPTVELALNFQPGNVATHEVTTNFTRDFRFEQPAVNKLRAEETSTTITTIFDRRIESVDENGWATAGITLKGLRVKVIKSNNVEVDYDSASAEAAANPLNKLIGQSYTIRINKNGRVEPLNLATVNTAGISGTEGRIAKRMFEAEEVIRRHQVLPLESSPAEVTVGENWSTIVPSPPGLLSSKSYKKTYTLTDVEGQEGNRVAVVKMTAGESAVPAEGVNAAGQGLGIFAKMLDNEDEYTGSLRLDLTTGDVLSYNETLISTYIAQEPNPAATPDQGPDTLRIRFIQKVDQKLID